MMAAGLLRVAGIAKRRMAAFFLDGDGDTVVTEARSDAWDKRPPVSGVTCAGQYCR